MGKFNNPGFILRIAIAVAYILIGISVFLIKNVSIFSSDILKYAFAALLISYGIFRAYRAFQLYKEQ
ncbi:MAG: hypothetical protein KA174_06055 [Chitinophagales bacterium]|jgi:uncharacterized membrane protein HdeD (DUF308 family)|nr:hypothetical protein [Chitinophagales bacterium]